MTEEQQQQEAPVFITLTHANNKKPIDIFRPQLFAIQYSESHKATLLFSTGSTVIPVIESEDEVKAKMQGL